MTQLVIGQDVRLTATLGVDITGGAVTLYWLKPSGAMGSIAGTVDAPTTGGIYADVTAATLDEAGKWAFRAEVLKGGKVIKTFGLEILVKKDYEPEE
jgi:hypothetical protein